MGYVHSVRLDDTNERLKDIVPSTWKCQEADMSAEFTLSASSIISWEQSCSA